MNSEAVDVLSLAGVTLPGEIVIVSGAGVSMGHPTHAPSGIDLMKQAMDDYFADGTRQFVERIYDDIARALDLPRESFRGRPRLEVVLDIANRIHGPLALRHLAANFTGRRPNRMHQILGAHLDAGGRQLTANFDHLIEAATTRPDRIYHFHGSIAHDDDPLPFGAYLREIARGFSEHAAESVLDPLTSDVTKLIIWIGYSFSDYFDLTPVVTQAIRDGGFDRKVLVWLDYAGSSTYDRSDLPANPPDIIRVAVERGIQVERITGSSEAALYDLLEASGCRMDSVDAAAQCTCTETPAHHGTETSASARAAASLALSAHFGLLGATGSIESDGSPPAHLTDPALLERYEWKKGRYRRAEVAALRALPPLPDPHRALREVLIHTRYAWIRGQLLRASRLSGRALRMLDASTPVEMEQAALECYFRVGIDIHRVPDARVIGSRRHRHLLRNYDERVERALRRNKEAAGSDGTASAFHSDAVTQFTLLMRGEGSKAPERSGARTVAIERFAQSEVIDSYIDYLRGEGNAGRWPFAQRRPWQEQMKDLYQIVGNDADSRRLVLFQGDPHDARGCRSLLESACALDVTPWHRLRMVVRAILVRTPGIRRAYLAKFS